MMKNYLTVYRILNVKNVVCINHTANEFTMLLDGLEASYKVKELKRN